MFREKRLIVAAMGILPATLSFGQIPIVVVPVTHAGNPADSCGLGSVEYEYRIGQSEVTNYQYAEFLNTVASHGDPYGLYSMDMNWHPAGGISRTGNGTNNEPYRYTVRPGHEDRPINFVSFYDAVRFVNWLHNGQSGTSTETGSYAIINGGPNTGQIVGRLDQATWIIPTENEWYKAAYHDPTRNAEQEYWAFPARTDKPVPPEERTGVMLASYDESESSGPGTQEHVSVVGGKTRVVSFYRTHNQGTTVREWTETEIDGNRRVRGGPPSASDVPHVQQCDTVTPGHADAITGFRVGCRSFLPLGGAGYNSATPMPHQMLGLTASIWPRMLSQGGIDLYLTGGGGGTITSSTPTTFRVPTEPPDTDQPDPTPNPEPTEDNDEPDPPSEKVPEPSSLMLLACGGGFLLRRRRR